MERIFGEELGTTTGGLYICSLAPRSGSYWGKIRMLKYETEPLSHEVAGKDFSPEVIIKELLLM